MPIRSVDRILSAQEFGGAKKYILNNQRELHLRRGVAVTIKNIDKPTGSPLYAFVLRGMWVAKCECNGHALVDPREPIYFCFECLNRANGSSARPVIFPPEEERQEIERLLLERPVDDIRGLTDLDRAASAQPLLYVEVEEDELPTPRALLASLQSGESPKVRKRIRTYPLPRSWAVGESLDDLRKQQEPHITHWKQSLRNQ